ncbi:uncharacterized protein LOC123519513 [Portunus trituberculatus]|uniref:uncharacterized protein LOC123519513 n=1 Tax=Portunus trituberculatus TaxID=210409 RepID=UPI001E1CDAA1|nr:uncharacterized protein LOC123519513 [Portunus trituberculatus]
MLSLPHHPTCHPWHLITPSSFLSPSHPTCHCSSPPLFPLPFRWTQVLGGVVTSTWRSVHVTLDWRRRGVKRFQHYDTGRFVEKRNAHTRAPSGVTSVRGDEEQLQWCRELLQNNDDAVFNPTSSYKGRLQRWHKLLVWSFMSDSQTYFP